MVRASLLIVVLACEGEPPVAPPNAPPVVPVIAHPVAPVTAQQTAAAPELVKPCDACDARVHAEVDGWKLVELRWGGWAQPFERFELHLVDARGQWGPLVLQNRPSVRYVEPHVVTMRTEDVDAGRLHVVEIRTKWRDAIGGEQDTTELVACRLHDRRCVRVQADSLYRSPEGSELRRHFDVTFENSRLLVRSPDEARCGSPPPGAVRSEDEPPLLWFGSHPWADVF